MDNDFKKMQDELNKRKIREQMELSNKVRQQEKGTLSDGDINRQPDSVPDTRASDFQKSFRDQMNLGDAVSEQEKGTVTDEDKNRFSRIKNLFGK